MGIDGRLANAPQRAGVGNFCAEVLRALPGQAVSITLRVYLDAPPSPGFPLTSDAAELRVLPPARFWSHRVLANELCAAPPSVFLSPVLQLPWRCPCPAVATAHDFAFLDFGEQFTWQRRVLARLQAHHAIRRADHLLAVSEATRKDLERHFQVTSERITVTQEAAAERFQPVTDPGIRKRIRAAYHLPDRFLLYVGRLQPRKNLVRLIEAFAAVCQRRSDLPHHLIIAGGKGWMYEPIYAAARQSSAWDRIQFLDYVADEDLPTLMSMADALALVSLWEGFGLPVLEAMACGTAVMTSDCSSLPEVAGDAALLVNPYAVESIATGLERILLDDAYRHDLEQRASARAGQFSWDAVARRIVEAVRATLNHNA